MKKNIFTTLVLAVLCSNIILPQIVSADDYGIFTSDPSSGIYTSDPSTGIYTSDPTAGIYTSYPSSGVYTSDPTAGIYTSFPSAGLYTSDPSSGIYTSDPTSGLYTSYPTSGVYTSDPTSGIYTSYPSSGVYTSDTTGGIYTSPSTSGIYTSPTYPSYLYSPSYSYTSPTYSTAPVYTDNLYTGSTYNSGTSWVGSTYTGGTGYTTNTTVNPSYYYCADGTTVMYSSQCPVHTQTCPTGSSYINGSCQITIMPGQCVYPGYALVSGGACVKHCSNGTTVTYPNDCQPITQCPSGQTLSGNVCVPTTQCPNGQTLINNVCVPTTQCPAGQTLSGNTCVPNTQCPTGTTLINNVCQVNTTICPSGTTMINGTCQINQTVCPSGTTLINGTCQVNTTVCPAGTTLLLGSCVVNSTSCPSGTTRINGTCQINTTSCPAGSSMVNGTCQINQTACPSGTTLTNGTCQYPAQCPTNSTLINGVCQAPVVCPSGTTFTNGTCLGQGTTMCPSGTTLINNICQINITACPTGTTLINGVCTINSTSCPVNTTYSNGACTITNVISNTNVNYTYPTYNYSQYATTYTPPVITTQSCWDGSVIPHTSICPSQYKVCANGTSVPVYQTCYVGVPYAPYVPPQVVKFNNVVTSAVTEITNTSARCNGIGLIAQGAPSTGWFEYGETANLGRQTATASIGSALTSPFSNVLASLKPQTTYYCRAVMQNQYGLVKGEIVHFTTKTKAVTYVKPITVIKKTTTVKAVTTVKQNQITCSDGSVITVGQSTATLLNQGQKLIALQMEKTNGNLSTGSNVSYKLTYKNLSNTRLDNVIMRITVPQEITFVSSLAGTYDSATHTLTFMQGSLDAFTEGVIVWNGNVNNDAPLGKTIVTTAYVAYSVPGTQVQDEVTAYVVGSILPNESVNNTDTGAKHVIGAGAGSGFLPNSLVEWLALIAILFIIFILARSIYASYKDDGHVSH
ncbi:MAG: EB domain-containing protein [Candidatus Paceibacterota bacterium]